MNWKAASHLCLERVNLLILTVAWYEKIAKFSNCQSTNTVVLSSSSKAQKVLGKLLLEVSYLMENGFIDGSGRTIHKSML